MTRMTKHRKKVPQWKRFNCRKRMEYFEQRLTLQDRSIAALRLEMRKDLDVIGVAVLHLQQQLRSINRAVKRSGKATILFRPRRLA